MSNLMDLVYEIEHDLRVKQLEHQEQQRIKMEELRWLIVAVSKRHGGDSEQFLSIYIETIFKDWIDDLDIAIKCFRDVLSQLVFEVSEFIQP